LQNFSGKTEPTLTDAIRGLFYGFYIKSRFILTVLAIAVDHSGRHTGSNKVKSALMPEKRLESPLMPDKKPKNRKCCSFAVIPDRLPGCFSWPLRFVVYSSGDNLNRRYSPGRRLVSALLALVSRRRGTPG